MPNLVKEIMRKAFSINVKSVFVDALKMMIENRTNSLLVTDDEGKLVGLINAGSLIKEVVPDYLEEDDAITAHFASEEIFIEDVKKVRNVAIEKFMITDPKSISADANLMEVAVMAISSNQLRIPVVDENKKPIGIVTRTEIKRVIGGILDIGDLS